MREVTVIGAGFSGLVAAWRLEKDGFRVTVVEKSAEVGGLLSTRNESMGLVESAANGLLCSKLVEELFFDCGLAIQTPNKSARRRFLAVGGKVARWPLTTFQTLQFFLKLPKARKSRPLESESLDSWANRNLGELPAQRLVAPAMLGIYAADLKLLSANLTIGKFFDKSKRNQRGRISGTVSAVGGMGALIRELRRHLESRGVIFKIGVDGKTALEISRSRRVPVVVATSAWDAAELLDGDRRQQMLKSVQSVPLATLTLFFTNPPVKRGFGILFSQSSDGGEPDGILGSLQNSEIFSGRASKGIHSETWILGGASVGEQMIARSDDQITDLVLQKRGRLVDPDTQRRLIGKSLTRWPRAIPLYSPELERMIPELLRDSDRIALFGNYLGDLGLASILESSLRLPERVRNI